MQKKENKDQSPDSFIKYSSIAFQMAIIMIIGVIGGWKLDSYFGFKFPFFTLVLTVLALILAIYTAIKDFIK